MLIYCTKQNVFSYAMWLQWYFSTMSCLTQGVACVLDVTSFIAHGEVFSEGNEP